MSFSIQVQDRTIYSSGSGGSSDPVPTINGWKYSAKQFPKGLPADVVSRLKVLQGAGVGVQDISGSGDVISVADSKRSDKGVVYKLNTKTNVVTWGVYHYSKGALDGVTPLGTDFTLTKLVQNFVEKQNSKTAGLQTLRTQLSNSQRLPVTHQAPPILAVLGAALLVFLIFRKG